MIDVSVITAAFNSASDIERNIRSVGTQTRRPREHIIVDDGSVDDTRAIADGLKDEFPQLRLIRQANRGAANARNTGIDAASSRYIAFLDSDDVWGEHKLEAQVEFMMTNSVAFSYGDYKSVDASTGLELGLHEAPQQLSYAALLRGCPIGCLTVAFDQTVLGKHHMPDVQRGQDWGLWLALTRGGTIARRYPGCHAYYHVSSGSLSSHKVGKAADIYRIYREQENLGPIRSFAYLASHIGAALAKRPVKKSGT
ncbi:MAG TPA: glycosyltransferase family 2 protein [Woeseiaceae bacterium]|nr:glycosyltransferase family 2 protein [Woeseiaceae bacterium]